MVLLGLETATFTTGAAQKSPSCDDWPFATRSKSDSAEGKELFAAVDVTW